MHVMAAAKAVDGKKIRWAARPVRVQVPPPAPILYLSGFASTPKSLRVTMIRFGGRDGTIPRRADTFFPVDREKAGHLLPRRTPFQI
jgi:hypothetical protein